MMVLVRQLENGRATLEVVAQHHARLLELGQHTVDGGQPHILAGVHQRLVDIFGAQVALFRFLQLLQDFHPRQGHFKARFSEILIIQCVCSNLPKGGDAPEFVTSLRRLMQVFAATEDFFQSIASLIRPPSENPLWQPIPTPCIHAEVTVSGRYEKSGKLVPLLQVCIIARTLSEVEKPCHEF